MPSAVLPPTLLETPRELDHIARLDPAVGRVDHKSQPGNAVYARDDLRGFRVDGQPELRQPLDDGPPSDQKNLICLWQAR